MKKVKQHIINWLIYILAFAVYTITFNRYFDKASFLIGTLLLIGVFYYNYLFALKFFTRKTALQFILYTLIGILIYINLWYLVFYQLLPYFHRPNFYSYKASIFISSRIYFYLTYTIYAIVVLFYQNKIIKQRQNLELKKQKLELEMENLELKNQKLELTQQKLIAEYSYLKTQINPHFLYNTLNYFVTKVMKYDETLSDGLLKLSAIMHYSLQNETPTGEVSLENELENMDNYICLQKLRFDDDLNMRYTRTGSTTGCTILPHILITVVENAFKHGNIRSKIQPIIIDIKIISNVLYLTVANEIKKAVVYTSSTGIGVQNMRNRLKMAYGEYCIFHIKNDGVRYSTHIIMPLGKS
jgi:two-component system, LytTR family, sensor kinase